MQLPHALDPAKRFVTQVMADEVPDLAAGLAYRFLFAVFPFGIFLAALAAFVAQWTGIGDPTNDILGALGDNLPPDIARQIAPQLETVLGQSRPGLLSIGALAALWAATGGISSLITGMNKAYDVDEDRSFFVRTGTALALTVIGSVGIVAAFVTIVGGSVLTEQAVKTLGIESGTWSALALLRFPVVLLMVAVAVGVLFHFGPNVRVSWRWTLLGGLVFAVGWLIATVGFAFYVANFANYANTYGALGGVIVMMLWFYLTALLLLLAAEVTSMVAKAKEPERIEAKRMPGRTPSGAPEEPDGDPDIGPGGSRGRPDRRSGHGPLADRDPRPSKGRPAPDRRRRPATSPAAASGITRLPPAPDRPPMSLPQRVAMLALLAAGAVIGAITGRVAGDDDDRGAASG